MKQLAWFLPFAGLTLPWLAIRLFGLSHSVLVQTAFSGVAIIGASFLLSWGGEASELFVSRSVSIAFLAFFATLPEYAVDFCIAAKAGHSPSYLPYAVANVTGASRLLIGAAWPFVAFLWWMRSGKTSLTVGKEHSLEFACLFLATFYSFLIPLKKTISVLDGVLLLGFYLFYLSRAFREKTAEPELEGPAAEIARLSPKAQKIAVFSLFLLAFSVIASAAGPFTDGLIATGEILHREGFLIIQIFAPFASELPEFIIAGWFAFRRKPGLGMAALLSAKLNQWTLLVGTIPIVYCISSLLAGHPNLSLAINPRQVVETLLTSSQCLFALVLLSNLRLRLWEGVLLFSLFLALYPLLSISIRDHFALLYLAAGILILLFSKTRRDGIGRLMGCLWKKEN